jgi:hypothetical protein
VVRQASVGGMCRRYGAQYQALWRPTVSTDPGRYGTRQA